MDLSYSMNDDLQNLKNLGAGIGKYYYFLYDQSIHAVKISNGFHETMQNQLPKLF